MPPFGKKPDGAAGQLLSVWLKDWYPKIEDEVSAISARLHHCRSLAIFRKKEEKGAGMRWDSVCSLLVVGTQI